MNVALTYFCNQKCAYCLAIDAMSICANTPEAREMTMDNLNKVMDFLKRSGILTFRMIGGEPTLHSRFEEVYDTVSNNGFSVMIFSNGLIDKKRVEFLSKKNNLKEILLNIRHPEEYLSKDWEKIICTLYLLNEKITLAYRVYKLDFDLRFLFDLIDKYKLKRLINLAIACPSLLSNNVYIRLEDHERVVKKMVEFSKESKKRNIQWYTDCGFILCAFRNGKLEKLKKNVGFVPEVNCFPQIHEVAPDLRVFRCFALAAGSGSKLKLTDFTNLAEVKKYFFVKSLRFKRIGGMDKCFKCKHLISQRCCSCMVHILKNFPDYKNMPAIF